MLGWNLLIVVSFFCFVISGCDSEEISAELNEAYTIGGNVSGLSGSLTLEIKSNQTVTVNQNGDFRFNFPLLDLSDYSVVIVKQPKGQICSLTNNAGSVKGADVTDITVDCSSIFKSFTGTIYGDSQADAGVVLPQGWMCETLNLQTDKNVILFRNAVGGYDLQRIRALFEAEFPKSGENFVIIEGGINDIINTGGSLDRMKRDISFMADAVISAGLKLILVNVPPWKGHRLHNENLQLLTDDYNKWLDSSYPDNVADIYSALEDPDNLDQLLPIYSASYPSVTNLHISKSGMRKVDEVIGKHFLFTDPGSIEPVAGNVFPYVRDLTKWYFQEVIIIGGDRVLAAGSKIISTQGIVGTVRDERHGISVSFLEVKENQQIEVSYLVRPGDKQWIRSSFINMSGMDNMSYIDVINLKSINHTGVVQAITKYSPGWVKVSIVTDSGSGGAMNLSIMAAEDDADNYFMGNAGTPDIYIDLVQVVLN